MQNLSPGNQVEEYNFTTRELEAGLIQWDESTPIRGVLNVNNGSLLLTPTNQSIYIKNASFTGWLQDPRSLTTGDKILDPLNDTWVSVRCVELAADASSVHDVITTGAHDDVAGSTVLYMKDTAESGLE